MFILFYVTQNELCKVFLNLPFNHVYLYLMHLSLKSWELLKGWVLETGDHTCSHGR